MKNRIYLRPHHLICLMSFRGEGYDGVFISKTGKIVEFLKNIPDEKLICVEIGGDDICRFCPNRKGELCKDEARISLLDSSFSKILGIQRGSIYCWSEVRQLVIDKLSARDFEKICHECQWFQICRSNLWP
ncbi:MAG: DUF1284 domain-containing protein [Holosporales bacterium]|nr:DUF1284 domain-containing protein [Holosporales bacterium]